MKLYNAGVYTASFDIGGSLYLRLTDNEKKQRESVRHILESYHYIHKESIVKKIRKDGKKIFLDSGAFSAFTQGVKIDIPGYCNYIKRNEDIIEKVDGVLLASVLDGIGDPLKTWQNQQTMESLGVRPLPCFHYGEDERYLEDYIQNYEYIAIGGMVPISTPQLFHWLDRIWDQYLTDGAGRAKVKVHGFGLTTIALMERYPWFSVDSSSWVQIARTGGMMLPHRGKVVSISERSPSRKVAGQHVDNLPEIMTSDLIKELESYGVDVKRARETYLARWAFNLWAFGELGENVINRGESRFKATQPLLF
jgi:hypothetical protein